MPAKLKVFLAHMGFFESVVAAPSQKAALEAWGVRQNLFGEGLARVTDEAEAVKAALAAPGKPLRRPAGAGGHFEDAASAPTRLPEPPKATEATPAGKAKPRAASPAPPPPPDRTALDAAEKALGDIEAKHNKALAELERARRDLEARAEAAEQAYAEQRRAAEKALKQAERDYQRALSRQGRD